MNIAATDDHLGNVAGLAGELAAQESRSATLSHVVVESDVPAITNTVMVTGTDGFNAATVTESTTAVVDVVLPVLSWAAQNYTVHEEGGTLTATVLLSPTNPYAEVSAQVTISDSAAAEFAATVAQEIVFPPGSGSQEVVVNVPDDDEYAPRTILLGLQTPIGAVIGGSNGGNAVVSVVEDDAVLGLEVSNSPNTTQADVGETITYTYRITNTGNVTLTILDPDDDLLGGAAGLSGELGPNATRSTTRSYVVQASDLPGPLVNTLTVTGTTSLGNSIIRTASATVSLDEPKVHLPLLGK